MTDNFIEDIGITQNWFNVGQQLLAAGMALCEVRNTSLPVTMESSLTSHRFHPIYFSTDLAPRCEYHGKFSHGNSYMYDGHLDDEPLT